MKFLDIYAGNIILFLKKDFFLYSSILFEVKTPYLR